MDYFKNNAKHFVFFESAVPNHGLRRGQVGALHALAAHFIENNDAAIVSLPTGYGKTAVMAGTCFIAKATRVLIIVPTAALRMQTAKAFKSLETLRRLGTIPATEELGSPVVEVIDERVTSEEKWLSIAIADVVIATPHSASPEIEGVVAPPLGFFDLVLIDEGHHSPAKTWVAFIRKTTQARHVLYSATPFRKDRLQLPGKLIFYYSLKKATEENAFSRVTYSPVIGAYEDKSERDAALIEKAVEVFNRDKAAGFQHRLLIRTNSIADALHLTGVYVDAGLRVKGISSRLSKNAVAEIESELVNGELDGVVCVDMFGEGYDFPRFKIAVLHVPHRSLVPTLQFIGRFARTNDEETGDATFIATPREVNAESAELYREGTDWDLLLADLADARQLLAIREREVVQAFQETAQPSADYEAINPGNFRLPQHIAAYKTSQPPNFAETPVTLQSLQVTNSWISPDQKSYLLVVKEVKAPVWSRGGSLTDSRHDCFLLKYFPETNILFITATYRAERYYSELITLFFGGNASPLSFEKIRNVLNGLEDQEFFSVGLRNTSPTATTESYRIVAGSQADRGVRDSDASHFCQGHFFGRGEVDGISEIIGASSGGRIWSNGKFSIPELFVWMDVLHQRISSDVITIGPSGLDRVSYGATLSVIPPNTVVADWSKESYRDNYPVVINNGDIQRRSCLLDLTISSIQVANNGMSLTFRVGDDTLTGQFGYCLNQMPAYISCEPGVEIEVKVRDDLSISFQDWLNDNMLTFYTSDLHCFTGTTINRRNTNSVLNVHSLQAFDWTGCDIQIEFDKNDPDRRTVQRHLQDYLLALHDLEFVIYDHRSGEAADFIVGQSRPGGRLVVTLYHCKGAGGAAPSGERIGDTYELAGQAVKSVRFQRKEVFLNHIERRTQPALNRGHSPILFGNRQGVIDAINQRNPIEIEISIVTVQPGLSMALLQENVKSVMAAANDSVASQQSKLTWLISH